MKQTSKFSTRGFKKGQMVQPTREYLKANKNAQYFYGNIENMYSINGIDSYILDITSNDKPIRPINENNVEECRFTPPIQDVLPDGTKVIYQDIITNITIDDFLNKNTIINKK